MTLNRKMANLLSEIQQDKAAQQNHILAASSPDVGDNLIRLYMHTTDQRTRELITLFMIEAGYGWLRKLVTRDTNTMIH